MKVQFAHLRWPYRKSILRDRLNDRLKTQRRKRPARKIQLIYAHFCAPVYFNTTVRLQLQHRIKQRAYQFWLAGGCRPGRALNDWLRAEAEVLTESRWPGSAGRNGFVIGQARL